MWGPSDFECNLIAGIVLGVAALAGCALTLFAIYLMGHISIGFH